MKEIDNITDIHSILFESLCYFDDFCRDHGINYFLANGTLLGAVKYNGFVPWDDDVDILLTRADYDKLMHLTEINNDRYRLLCREQVPEWRMPYAKLSREDTIIKEGDYNFGVEFGLAMDIFPIDKWSPYLWIAKIQAFRCEFLKRLLVCSIGDTFTTERKGLKRLILISIYHMGKILGHKRILHKILRSTEKSKKRKKKYMGCLSWTCHLHKEVLPASCFENTEYLTFCGRQFPVFSDYEMYLDSLYGAWREDLPKENQHSNHIIKVWHKNAE